MKIGGDYSVFPGGNSWPRPAADLRLPADKLVDRMRELGMQPPDIRRRCEVI